MSALAGFRPCVADWFRRTFKQPSPVQEMAWPAIRRGENTLLLAPTGSGKTLAAFLCAIDDLFGRAREGRLADGVQVVYISPLKALGNDIHRNLLEPLAGIREGGERELPEVRVAVRTGDTPQSERTRMTREPPHILITTPESLYLLLLSARMEEALARVRTVIVDEVHSLCDNKRGVHLTVSLERLEARPEAPLQRVGCSATLNPLEEIAAFLVGFEHPGEQRPCTVIDAGMRKDLDVQVTAPLPDFLEASNSALWASAYELLIGEISRHTTTLVFTNSRYKAERTALHLQELSDGGMHVAAHHGSMSKETRLRAEGDLKGGRLDALVATASLELGIDIGSIDLVYQLESPRSVATGLQRIGRAGHLLDATSKGRILAFERDELMEAAAICRSMYAGEVDAVRIPKGCLDVLAQQIAGAVSLRPRQADDLFALVRRAYPYAGLEREQFDAVLGMLAGDHPFQAAWPPRSLILWDRPTGKVSPTRTTKHVSAMCVGTIPESAEYAVVMEDSRRRVGTLESQFVDDCLRTGDVFVLGSSSWKMVGVRKDRVLVEQAPGATPTVPWWHGPVQPRTSEVGRRVGRLRRGIARRLDDPGAVEWLRQQYRLSSCAAVALADYVRVQKRAAGLVPDEQHLLVESWRDELGQLNVIVHSPYGAKINRTWGIALVEAARRRFAQQWSALGANDVIVLTRPETEVPPLHQVDGPELMRSVTACSLPELVRSGVRDAAGLGGRFRDAAACSLQVLRAWQGNRVPHWLLNQRAADLYEVARHHEEYPVMGEVLREYLHDALDLPGLRELLEAVEREDIRVSFRHVESPSPFAHSVLIQQRYRADHQMGRERRAHLLRLHRRVLQEVLSEEQMAELLDERAIQRLEERYLYTSGAARARNADELAQVIRELGDLPATESALQQVADGDAVGMLESLVREGRVVAVRLSDCEQDPVRLVAADVWRQYHDAFRPAGRKTPLALLLPQIEDGRITGFEQARATDAIPRKWRRRMDRTEARAAIIERFLERRGPVTKYEIMNYMGWPVGTVESILDDLVGTGKVARGTYTGAKPSPQWVDRANLEEVHRLTMQYLKRELAACAPYEVVDFLTRWQHCHPDTRLEGMDGLREIIRQLQGIEIIQGALESDVLPGRIVDYRPEMLDSLMASGEVCWRRVSTEGIRRGMITLCLRTDGEWLAGGSALRFDAAEEADCDIAESIIQVREYFRRSGPVFFDEVLEATGLPESEVLRAVWHLVWCGELYCDTYECIRHAEFTTTLSACYDLMNRPWKILEGRDSVERVVARMERKRLDPRLGRWVPTERLVAPAEPMPEQEMLRRWARQLLDRWGVVSRDILEAEVAAPAWAHLVPELKRMELMGKVSRGYFIEGHRGEQYGLAEAIELLRDCRARRSEGKELGYLPGEPPFCITNRDPTNLYASSLRMLNESGAEVDSNLRLSNTILRMVVQAGQPIILPDGKQTVTLTRHQLAECAEQLKYDRSGREAAVQFERWNDYPVEVHPASTVLEEVGFRMSKGRMRWPPPARSEPAAPPDPEREEFCPYHLDPPPVEFGPDWVIDHAARALRPAVEEVLRLVQHTFAGDAWEFQWERERPGATYRGMPALEMLLRKSYVRLIVHAPGVTDSSERHTSSGWGRVEKVQDVNEDYRRELAKRRDDVQAAIDRHLETPVDEPAEPATAKGTAGRYTGGKAKQGEKEMAGNVVRINRAPVLTLWAAVVSETLGYDTDEALSLGRAVAGMNAQSKGRRLGIYGPPKAQHRGEPKKVGLGEDFWVEVCGRPVPVKNTEDGIRAVVKDKPIEPEKVRTYLEKKFGDELDAVIAAMKELAESLDLEDLEEEAYGLYEEFRPQIARGRRGWGQKGDLDLDHIRSLARTD